MRPCVPALVATENIEALVCMELGLSFEMPVVRKRWYDNSLREQLKRLVEWHHVAEPSREGDGRGHSERRRKRPHEAVFLKKQTVRPLA